MKSIQIIMIGLILVLAIPGFAGEVRMPASPAPADDAPCLDTILDNLECTYLSTGFGAVFIQTTRLG